MPAPASEGLTAFQYDVAGHEEWRPDTLGETSARRRPGQVLWVNLNAPLNAEFLASLERDYGVHPLTLEDVQHRRQRPKVETYPGYVYVVAQMLKTSENGRVSTEQVSILLGDTWVLTIQEGLPGDTFEAVRAKIRQGRPALRGSGSDFLLYALLDAVVDAAFPILEALSNKAAEIEDELLERRTQDVQAALQSVRRDVLVIRRVAWPQRDSLTALERNEIAGIRPETRVFLRDVTDHATRVIDFVENARELLASLMDLYLATVAQRTNDVVKVLTVISAIFIPLTFIAGVYGMNFDHMPELRSPWGYPAVMAFMAALAGGMLLLFRRKGWF